MDIKKKNRVRWNVFEITTDDVTQTRVCNVLARIHGYASALPNARICPVRVFQLGLPSSWNIPGLAYSVNWAMDVPLYELAADCLSVVRLVPQTYFTPEYNLTSFDSADRTRLSLHYFLTNNDKLNLKTNWFISHNKKKKILNYKKTSIYKSFQIIFYFVFNLSPILKSFLLEINFTFFT